MRVEHNRTNRTIKFRPANGITRALAKHGMENCAPKDVPMSLNVKLEPAEIEAPAELKHRCLLSLEPSHI